MRLPFRHTGKCGPSACSSLPLRATLEKSNFRKGAHWRRASERRKVNPTQAKYGCYSVSRTLMPSASTPPGVSDSSCRASELSRSATWTWNRKLAPLSSASGLFSRRGRFGGETILLNCCKWRQISSIVFTARGLWFSLEEAVGQPQRTQRGEHDILTTPAWVFSRPRPPRTRHRHQYSEALTTAASHLQACSSPVIERRDAESSAEWRDAQAQAWPPQCANGG